MSTPKKKQKLARLPKDAKISKRPLPRPSLPSPYAGASSQKTVYISTKTPFMSAVKRVEKLLRLSDKRLVQSAKTIAQDRQYRKRRRGGDCDEIEAIAEVAEEQKRKKGDGVREEVVVKGTGKAISRVMELGVWFQQRGEEFGVRVVTGSVSSIDDVEYEKEVEEGEGGQAKGGAESEEMDVDQPGEKNEDGNEAAKKTFVSEARIRKVSVLEVHVSLR